MTWSIWIGLLSCTTTTAELLTEADATRTGEDGADGPFGAARLRLAAPARVSEVAPTQVVFPTLAQYDVSEPTAAVTDAPVIVFVHGGLVSPDRYYWLAAHWATRGYVVVLPRAELGLAITQPGKMEPWPSMRCVGRRAAQVRSKARSPKKAASPWWDTPSGGPRWSDNGSVTMRPTYW